MISRRVKLRLTTAQAAELDRWFQVGTGVWNWGLSRFIAGDQGWRLYSNLTPPPPDVEHRVYPKWLKNIPGERVTRFGLYELLNGHSKRVGVSSFVLRGIINDLDLAWSDYKAGTKGIPKRKGVRNHLSSLCFTQDVRMVNPRHFKLPVIGLVKFHLQKDLASMVVGEKGRNLIKQGRLQRLPRGWYITLQIDTAPKTVPITDNLVGGADPGHTDFMTIAWREHGQVKHEVIPHPKEYQRLERRLGQAARSGNKRLLGRIHQRIANARRVRNHLISRHVVGRYAELFISKDNLKGLQRTTGKAVMSAGFGQLRGMIDAKSRQAGRTVTMVPSYNSTRTCSDCKALTGPRGRAGLSVRDWGCTGCGAHHDREVNAAVNTLDTGAASAH